MCCRVGFIGIQVMLLLRGFGFCGVAALPPGLGSRARRGARAARRLFGSLRVRPFICAGAESVNQVHLGPAATRRRVQAQRGRRQEADIGWDAVTHAGKSHDS